MKHAGRNDLVIRREDDVDGRASVTKMKSECCEEAEL